MVSYFFRSQAKFRCCGAINRRAARSESITIAQQGSCPALCGRAYQHRPLRWPAYPPHCTGGDAVEQTTDHRRHARHRQLPATVIRQDHASGGFHAARIPRQALLLRSNHPLTGLAPTATVVLRQSCVLSSTISRADLPIRKSASSGNRTSRCGSPSPFCRWRIGATASMPKVPLRNEVRSIGGPSECRRCLHDARKRFDMWFSARSVYTTENSSRPSGSTLGSPGIVGLLALHRRASA